MDFKKPFTCSAIKIRLVFDCLILKALPGSATRASRLLNKQL